MALWTQKEDALLTELWAKGLSATQIMAMMPRPMTRNAVIGRISRLQLPGRTTKVRARSSASNLPLRPTRRQSVLKTGQGKALTPPATKLLQTLAAEMRAAIEAPKSQIEITVSLGVALLDLPPNGCRWPVNQAPRGEEHLFCGELRLEGKSYCRKHHALSVAKGIRYHTEPKREMAA